MWLRLWAQGSFGQLGTPKCNANGEMHANIAYIFDGVFAFAFDLPDSVVPTAAPFPLCSFAVFRVAVCAPVCVLCYFLCDDLSCAVFDS